MYTNIVTVTCPWCSSGFLVPIKAKYKNAEAIIKDEGGYLGIKPCENKRCPNSECKREIVLHYIT